MEKKILRHKKNSRLEFPLKCDDGYGYCVYRTKGDVRYIKCYEANAYACPARGKIVNGKPHLSKDHNHEKDEELDQDQKFQDALYNATITPPFVSLRRIYDSICIKHSEAAVKLTWARMEPVMENWRRRVKPRYPPIPANLEQYVTYLSMPEWIELLNSPGGSLNAVTLITDKGDLLTLLFDPVFVSQIQNTSQLFMDATFKITPRRPKIYQIFSILGLINDNQALPLCWVLMTKKSAENYRAALWYFKNYIAPHINPEIIMTDFETALQIVLTELYPESTHSCCFFHFCQALTKKLKSLGLLELVANWKYARIILRKLMALALLPPEDIFIAYEWLIRNIPENIKLILVDFLAYFQDQWITKTDVILWSVYGHRHRTNNLNESYHKKLGIRFGSHPSIWDFTIALAELQAVTRIELKSLMIGERITRPARRNTDEMNEKINRAWLLYKNKILDIPTFLACASNFLQAFQKNVHNDFIDNFDGLEVNVAGNFVSVTDNDYEDLLVFAETDVMGL